MRDVITNGLFVFNEINFPPCAIAVEKFNRIQKWTCFAGHRVKRVTTRLTLCPLNMIATEA